MALQGRAAAEPRPPGFFASLRRLGSTLLATLVSRAELLAHEIERERLRIARLALLAIGALFFLALGAITATVFVIVLFWDSQRLVAIGFLAVVYLAIGGGIAAYAKREASRGSRPFSASLEALRKDREHCTRP